MKKNYFAGILIVILTIGMFFSCQNSSKTISGNSITFDSILISKQIPLLQENDTTLPFSQVDIKFTYPIQFGSKEDLAQLQQIFVGTFFNDVRYDSLAPKKATDQYLADYEESYKALSNDYYSDKSRLSGGEIPSWYWYQLSNKNNILYRNDSLISYSVEYSDYTGGAHGSYRIMFFNIDLNNIGTISEEDLFKPDYYKPLTEKIVDRLMKQYNAPVPDSLMMQGFFTLDDIVPNNNFWLDDNNIHYAYNQYEIAPYSMGVIEVSIPYTDLSDILNPNGIIARYFLKKTVE